MTPTNLSLIRRKLLRWYENNRRDLPWRKRRDPYAIWIAETMLQQTQVTTVIPYYERFLNCFPTVHALARAPLRKVLALWSGLGYYRRAENLNKAARQLARNHGGRLPDDYEALRALPGVGDYTAGALMSIAFGKPYPAIDGNVRRVFGRLFNLRSENELRAGAKRVVPRSRPGYFNQGLMELGATICIPKKPRCPECPIARYCVTRNNGRRSGKPASRGLRQFRDVVWPLAIVRRRGKILLRLRPSGGILAGLWEFPGGEVSNRESVSTSLKRHLREEIENGALRCRIGELRHSVTNQRIRAPVFLFDLFPATEIRLPTSRWRWLSPSSLPRYPVSSMTLKAAKILAAYEKNSL